MHHGNNGVHYHPAKKVTHESTLNKLSEATEQSRRKRIWSKQVWVIVTDTEKHRYWVGCPG